MNLKVVVDRMQYGVGQGGFHCQQVAVHADTPGVHIEPYRFVYDCGSDTGPVPPNRVKPLDWAVRHYAGRSRVNSSKPKVTVNSLYLSHFQKDHIDGAFWLTELTDVKEIVIPHITREQVAHIFAQQVGSGSFGSSGAGAERYLGVLQRAANGDGPIIGNVPTTRVPSSPGDVDHEPSNQQPPSEPTPNLGEQGDGQEPRREEDANWTDKPFNWKQLKAGHYELTHPQRAGMSWSHQTSRLLALNGKGAAIGQSLKNLWELRVWSYAQSLTLSEAIADELGKLVTSNGVPALPKLLGGLVDGSEIAWAIKHRVKVQKAYKTALKAHDVKNAQDHNVVSLCLHSGPVAIGNRVSQLLEGRSWNPNSIYSCLFGPRNSWVGTGDALLSGFPAWTEFEAHFKQGKDRVAEWMTVLVPHHGSGAGGNFNQKLMCGGGMNAVISAGAFNKYGHPAAEVLTGIMDSAARPILVSEFSRPGFVERLKYDYSISGWSL